MSTRLGFITLLGALTLLTAIYNGLVHEISLVPYYTHALLTNMPTLVLLMYGESIVDWFHKSNSLQRALCTFVLGQVVAFVTGAALIFATNPEDSSLVAVLSSCTVGGVGLSLGHFGAIRQKRKIVGVRQWNYFLFFSGVLFMVSLAFLWSLRRVMGTCALFILGTILILAKEKLRGGTEEGAMETLI